MPKTVSRLLLVALFAASLLAQALHGPIGGCQHGAAGSALCVLSHEHDHGGHDHAEHSHAAHSHSGHVHHEHSHAVLPAGKAPVGDATPPRCPEGDDCVVCKVLAQTTDPSVPAVALCGSSHVEVLGLLSPAQPASPFRAGCLPRGPPLAA